MPDSSLPILCFYTSLSLCFMCFVNQCIIGLWFIETHSEFLLDFSQVSNCFILLNPFIWNVTFCVSLLFIYVAFSLINSGMTFKMAYFEP